MKMKSKRNVDLRTLFLLVFLIVGVIALIRIPDFFQSDLLEDEAYAANKVRIEQMTQTERDRVNRRAQRYFEELNDTDRERIRQLHHDLQHEHDAKDLKEVMARFNDWFTSLSPYEREDLREKLRKADNPEQKRVIIEQSRDEQFVRTLDRQDRQTYERITDPEERKKKIAEFRNRPELRYGRGSNLAIEIEKLEPLLFAIKNQLILNDVEKKELDNLTGAKQYYRVMALMLKQRSRQRGQSSAPFSDSNLRELVNSKVDDPDVKKKLIGFRSSRSRVPYLIGHSLFKVRGKTAGNPTDQELSKFFANLEPERREELRQTSSSDRKRRLRQWYFRSGGDDGAAFQEYMSEYFRLIRGGRYRPPSGGRGPRGGKPPEKGRPTGPPEKRSGRFGQPKI